MRASVFVAASSLAVGMTLPAFGYSHIAFDVEQLAALSTCAVQGTVVLQEVFTRGNGTFTRSSIAIEKSAGGCDAQDGFIPVEEYGGRLPDGDLAGVAGVDLLRRGETYVLMLSRSTSAWTSVEGPQGAIRLVVETDPAIVGRDLTGQAIAEAFSKESGPSSYLKPLGRSAPTKRAPTFAFETAERRAHTLFDRVASLVNTPAKAQAAVRELRRRLFGVSDLPAARTAPVVPIAAIPKYSHTSATGAPWNIRTSLAPALIQAARDVLAEWAKHTAGHSVPYGSFDDGYGINGRNDFAGILSTATAQSVYGRAWNAGELGVTLFRGSESDVMLNDAWSWSYDDYQVRWGLIGSQSVYATLTHEMGHGLGLGHSAEMAVMTACEVKKGWAPWPDDIVGIRARWPSEALAPAATGIRFFAAAGSSFSCASATQPQTGRTPFFYDPVARTITVGAFSMTNSSTITTSGSVSWYLRPVCNAGEACAADTYAGNDTWSLPPNSTTTITGTTLAVPPQLNGTLQLFATTLGPGASTTPTELVPWTFQLSPVHRPSTDVNADKRSDILWYNTATGQVYRMLMNGPSILGQSMVYQEPNLAWRPFGEGDMYADGLFDLLWRRSSGEIYSMSFDNNGNVLSGSLFMTVADPNWKLIGSAGIQFGVSYQSISSDLLWWNSASGEVWLNVMSAPNGSWFDSRSVYREPDTNWRPVGIGDFAGSGKRKQILWRNVATGSVYLQTISYVRVLSINRVDVTGQMIYQEPNTAWKIVGVADFNGDGKHDILWRNDANGQVYIMLMQDTAIMSEGMVYAEPNLAWKIVALGDYDGDGKDDLLWRNDSTGQVYLMTMSGLTVKSGAMIYSEPSLAWKILGVREFGQPIAAIGGLPSEATATFSAFSGVPLNPGRIGGDVMNHAVRID